MNETIKSWYTNYAYEHGLTVEQAMNVVDKFDVKGFSNQAAEYVKNHDFSDVANEQLKVYNLKMKENRLRYLLEQLKSQSYSLYGELEQELYNSFNKVASETFKELGGVLGENAGITKEQLDSLLYKELGGDSFSSAIWKNKRALLGFLETEIPTLILSGARPDTVANKLSELMNVEKWKTKRILRTEATKVQADVQRRYYKNNKIKRYEYIAEATACKICSRLSGRKFDVEDFEPGTNAEPMHPNCRCTTIPVVEK